MSALTNPSDELADVDVAVTQLEGMASRPVAGVLAQQAGAPLSDVEAEADLVQRDGVDGSDDLGNLLR